VQLTAGLLALAALVAVPSVAAADGSIALRGAYYKERSTRVQQPMLDARFDVGEHGELEAHALIDAITSASPAAGAADGAAFTETRWEVGLGYRHDLGRGRVRVAGRYSDEADYASTFAQLRGELDLRDRTTTLALGAAFGRDRITNAGAQTPMSGEAIAGRLTTLMASASIAQVVRRTLVANLGYDLIRLHGFQENPYRLVAAGGELELERVPATRRRHALAGGLRWFVPATTTTLIGSYRLYLDDWGVVGHTPEVRAIQQVADGIDVALRYRLHTQGAADFYRELYGSGDPTREPFLTADVKLSALRSQTVGAKLGVALGVLGIEGALGEGRVDLQVERIWQTTYVGDAYVAEVGVTLPFAY
jgi:hypothetical protein